MRFLYRIKQLLFKASMIGILIEEYPYLVDPIYKTSRTEAKRLYAVANFPTTEDMLAKIRAENNFSKAIIEAMDSALARKAERERSLAYRFKQKIRKAFGEVWEIYRTFRLNHFFKTIGIPRFPEVRP